MKINKGEFVSIIGPSGSGKSASSYLLGGLDHPGLGVIRVANKNLNNLSANEISLFREKI